MINFLDQNNYRIFNIEVAKKFGLNCSIYLSEIMFENKDYNCVSLNEEMIASNTTLDFEQQSKCKKMLEQLCILSSSAEGKLILDLNQLSAIINSESKTLTNKIKKINLAATGGKLTVRQKQCNDLKSKLTCSNEELLKAYQDWIDGVYSNPKGFLSFRAVVIFQKTVDEFAKGNLDLALKIIDIATIGGYRDATWAINVFNKDYAHEFKAQTQVSAPPPCREVKLGTEVF